MVAVNPCLVLHWSRGYSGSTMTSDTSPEAAAIQLEILRRMTTAQRLKLALEMSESMRNVALAGLRSRRPELNADELSRELMRIMYGFLPTR